MNTEEQIDEMVKIITGYEDCGDCKNCNFHGCCIEERIAINLYIAGYRKQNERGCILRQNGKGICSNCHMQDSID